MSLSISIAYTAPMLDVIAHSQRGRVCEYRRADVAVTTPLVMRCAEGTCDEPMYISVSHEGRTLHIMGTDVELDQGLLTTKSSGISAPVSYKDGIAVVRLPFADDVSVPEETEIVVVPNAFELRKDARAMVAAIIQIKEAVGNNVLLCMPGIADASTLALLSYMGVDIFDDSVARSAGLMGVQAICEGEIATGNDETSANLSALAVERDKIIIFTKAERLRELADQRAPSSPSSVAVLRIFDNEGYAFQEEECSTVGCRFECNTTQALRRPEVLRYRKAILERYDKPKHKRVLLLLPCSAKKPYHTSKTHKRFASAIHTGDHDTVVHEVIVTSPLGVVPRELDVFFPANSYDIPVTGEWKCEEKQFIRDLLAHIISQKYDVVISHLGEDTDLVRGLCELKETVVGDPTSPASLTKLDETLREVTLGMEGVGDYMTDRKETIRSVLKFQFGREAADLIMDDSTFGIGKYPYWKIIRGKNTQLGMLSAERGMVSLTLEGAQILADHGFNTVEMGDFELTGSLYAVGVMDADPRIRIGDEAIVTHDGKVMAVGVAFMSGREMKELRRGVAVKIRHRAK
jgi:archaeosine synthase